MEGKGASARCRANGYVGGYVGAREFGTHRVPNWRESVGVGQVEPPNVAQMALAEPSSELLGKLLLLEPQGVRPACPLRAAMLMGLVGATG